MENKIDNKRYLAYNMVEHMFIYKLGGTNMNPHNDEMCEVHCIQEELVRNIEKNMLPDDFLCDLADFFKVFGDTTRIKIIYVLSQGEMCVCDIAAVLGISQSAVSHQLRVLRQARLVKYRKEGKIAFYSLDDDHVLQIFKQGIEHLNHR